MGFYRVGANTCEFFKTSFSYTKSKCLLFKLNINLGQSVLGGSGTMRDEGRLPDDSLMQGLSGKIMFRLGCLKTTIYLMSRTSVVKKLLK